MKNVGAKRRGALLIAQVQAQIWLGQSAGSPSCGRIALAA